MDFPRPLTRLRVKLPPDVHAQRPDRRDDSHAHADGRAKVGKIERVVPLPHVARVEEHRELGGSEERMRQLGRKEAARKSADDVVGIILRTQILLGETSQIPQQQSPEGGEVAAERVDVAPPDPERPYAPLVGGADQVVAEFRRYRELGLTQVHCHFVAPDLAARHEVMHRFAEELRPQIEA